jgi:hypothetical protein
MITIYDDAMRTIVDIHKQQLELLDTYSKQARVSRSALIRQAIDLFIKSKIKSADKSAFGIWKDKPFDALTYQDKLRDEWEEQ